MKSHKELARLFGAGGARCSKRRWLVNLRSITHLAGSLTSVVAVEGAFAVAAGGGRGRGRGQSRGLGRGLRRGRGGEFGGRRGGRDSELVGSGLARKRNLDFRGELAVDQGDRDAVVEVGARRHDALDDGLGALNFSTADVLNGKPLDLG
jgi:hypothetical protein